MSELPDNPAESKDPKALMKYFVEILNHTPEEAESIVKNWLRTKPQTMEEVKKGVDWERENRLASYEEGIKK